MIDKETAIELAKQAGGLLTEFVINCTKGMRFHNLDALTSLCNLAVAHAQKDAEPVAWAMHREDGLVFDVICPEEHQSYEGKYTLPLFTRPAHDDTALLRQALEAMDTCRIMGADVDGNYTKEITPKVIQTAITALNERLGGKA